MSDDAEITTATKSNNQAARPVWTCPPPRPLSAGLLRRAENLYRSIGQLNIRPAGAMGVAGLELQAAILLLEGYAGLQEADNQYWKYKCRRLFLRPAIEPIAHSYWPRFAELNLDLPSSLNLASALAGKQLMFRSKKIIGKSVRGDVDFEPLLRAGCWLDDILSVFPRSDMFLSRPVYTYARALMSHPFNDGNGRFARVLIHACLASCARLKRPQLALSPIFYWRAATLGDALTELSRSENWDHFGDILLTTIDESLHLTATLLKKRRLR